jgi:hypothetical protein
MVAVIPTTGAPDAQAGTLDGTFLGGAALETSMSAEAWLSMPIEIETAGSVTAVDTGAPNGPEERPRPLEEGERIELWLASGDPEAPDGAVSAAADLDISQLDLDGWDVRPAQVAAAAGPFVAVAAGGWGLSGEPGTPSAPGARAILRRLTGDGIAEWEGTIATGAENVRAAGHPGTAGAAAGTSNDTDAGLPARPGAPTARAGGTEAILVIRIDPNGGRTHQRRRSQRLAVRLSPVRLVPLTDAAGAGRAAAARRALEEDPDLAPVARLSDVSAHGAAIVVDTPLETGTTVALEFELPGETAPFTVRGRVVEPAVALHGDVQPQPDGLPGFRRGIEFLGHAASRESRRLAAVVGRLLQSDATRR